MISDEVSPCMVTFMRGKSIGIALSTIWVIKGSRLHEGDGSYSVRKAHKRKGRHKKSRGI